jgi:hypothetical protein
MNKSIEKLKAEAKRELQAEVKHDSLASIIKADKIKKSAKKNLPEVTVSNLKVLSFSEGMFHVAFNLKVGEKKLKAKMSFTESEMIFEDAELLKTVSANKETYDDFELKLLNATEKAYKVWQKEKDIVKKAAQKIAEENLKKDMEDISKVVIEEKVKNKKMTVKSGKKSVLENPATETKKKLVRQK